MITNTITLEKLKGFAYRRGFFLSTYVNHVLLNTSQQRIVWRSENDLEIRSALSNNGLLESIVDNKILKIIECRTKVKIHDRKHEIIEVREYRITDDVVCVDRVIKAYYSYDVVRINVRHQNTIVSIYDSYNV